MKWLILFLITVVFLYANTVKPSYIFKASGNISDTVLKGNTVIVSTDAGSIESYDINSKKSIKSINFSLIKDFMGDMMPPKIFSIDYLESANQYLAVVQTSGSYRELFLIHKNKRVRVIDSKDRYLIAKARFIDKDTVIMALLGNEYILYDLTKRREIYRVHAGYSRFSDFAVDSKKKILVGSSESGEITVFDIENGKIIRVLKGGNVDNVYKVDIKNGKVLGAGQDRRGVIYDLKKGSFLRFNSDFFIYAGALNKEGSRVALSFNENNDIVIFDILSKKRLKTLVGQKSIPGSIFFVDKKTILSGSSGRFITIWRLK